jgi:hypothetical protein
MCVALYSKFFGTNPAPVKKKRGEGVWGRGEMIVEGGK